MEKLGWKMASRQRLLGIVVALVLMGSATASAQTIYNDMAALSSKYRSERGVMTMACDGGLKLHAVKMMLRKEYGEEFANKIEAFVIIAQKGASDECVARIADDIAPITSQLQPIDVSQRIKEGSQASGYVRLTTEQEHITDLLIVVTSPHPTIIYLGGRFNARPRQTATAQ